MYRGCPECAGGVLNVQDVMNVQGVLVPECPH